MTDCSEKHQIICRKILFVRPNCNKMPTYTNLSSLATMLDPGLKKKQQLAIAYQKAEIKDMMQRLNHEVAFKSIFETLWYSINPCFQVHTLTPFMGRDTSFLRYCEWKGHPVPCSAIFKAFPTDQGICCSFNMKAADEIYTETRFRDILLEMQSIDKMSSAHPKLRAKVLDFKTQPGKNRGLFLMLDAQSNMMLPGSVHENRNGFTAVIEPSRSFPFMSQKGFQISPGFNNLITLIISEIKADENLRNLDKSERNCLFPEDHNNLKLHKEYSYLNCKFECFLFYSQMELFRIHRSLCQPWFFPKFNDSIKVCDPWESNEFFRIMTNEIPDSICSHCLPDCDVLMYKPKIIVQPFDNCDASSLGVNKFCTFDFKYPSSLQSKIISQIQKEFQDPETLFFINFPEYLRIIETSAIHIRNRGFDVFKNVPKTYDSFSKDVAMVQIISQVSISSTFYVQIFCMNVISGSFFMYM